MELKKKSLELTTWNPELGCWEGTIATQFNQQWCDENGYLHRKRGPAIITYREKGNPYQEIWCLHGKRHREGAPAWIMYSRDGTPWDESWYLHGELSTPLYSRETLVKLVTLLGIEGFRKHGEFSLSLTFFVTLCPDLDSLLK